MPCMLLFEAVRHEITNFSSDVIVTAFFTHFTWLFYKTCGTYHTDNQYQLGFILYLH